MYIDFKIKRLVLSSQPLLSVPRGSASLRTVEYKKGRRYPLLQRYVEQSAREKKDLSIFKWMCVLRINEKVNRKYKGKWTILSSYKH